MYRLYFHPSCATSYEVISGLIKSGALERVELVSTTSPAAAISYGVWSVPWLVVDGRPAATDPVTADEALAIISGERVDVGDPVEAFMNAVLHSSFASAVAIAHGSLEPVIHEDLLSAATRAPFSGVDVSAVADDVRRQAPRLFEEWRDRIRRALSVSFVREIYWASGGQATPSEVEALATPRAVGLWLIAKASVGRSALPFNPARTGQEDLEAIASFVRRAAHGLLAKVREEQEAIYGDLAYVSVIKKARAL